MIPGPSDFSSDRIQRDGADVGKSGLELESLSQRWQFCALGWFDPSRKLIQFTACFLRRIVSNVGVMDGIPGLTDCIFDLALRLLGKALDLEWRITGQPANLALGASYQFVYRSLHSILIHRSTSVVLTLQFRLRYSESAQCHIREGCILIMQFETNAFVNLIASTAGSVHGRGPAPRERATPRRKPTGSTPFAELSYRPHISTSV